MVELNNSIFYKVRFNISANNEGDDLLWRIVCHIKTWLTRKHRLSLPNAVWTRLKKGSIQNFNEKGIFIETESFEESENMIFWACRISEKQAPKGEYAPREWITEVGIKPIQKGCVEFSCVISYQDRPGFIGICEDEPFPNVPNLIKNILNDSECSCSFGSDRIAIEPQELKKGEWLNFWSKVHSSERLLPYIFVNIKDNGYTGKTSSSVDPKKLAIAAGGNAIVFYTKNTSIIDEMEAYCPHNYKCYIGSLRIYQPYVNLSDEIDYRRHRFISATSILELGEDAVVQMLRRALAQDVHFYETFFRVKDCRQKKEAYIRQLRLAELKEKSIQITEKERETKDWYDLAIAEEEKRLQKEDELAATREELQTIKEENYRLTTEMEAYHQLSAKNAELERACKNRLNTKFYPQTAVDIINYFDATFGDCIAFSEDVEKSLKDCTIPLDELWSCLYYLATELRDLYIYGSGDIYKEFSTKTGIAIGRGEGKNTHRNKKFMKQYETCYCGKTIDIEAHIKCSKYYQRIHFGFCQENQKVIVGWCGTHKDNATTQKVK